MDRDAVASKSLRSVVNKHGWLCSIATMGYIVPDYFKLLGNVLLSWGAELSDIRNGLATSARSHLILGA